MTTRILTGTKSEIAATVAQLDGEIREVIVFLEDPADAAPAPSVQGIFAEMDLLTVSVGGADYSRQSIYTRLDDE